jgi:hypothetical protein
MAREDTGRKRWIWTLPGGAFVVLVGSIIFYLTTGGTPVSVPSEGGGPDRARTEGAWRPVRGAEWARSGGQAGGVPTGAPAPPAPKQTGRGTESRDPVQEAPVGARFPGDTTLPPEPEEGEPLPGEAEGERPAAR